MNLSHFKNIRQQLARVFFGKSPKKTLLRLFFFTIPVAFILFKWVLVPRWIEGTSMEPTISNGTLIITLAWKKPTHYGAIVCIRLAGNNIAYLKRIVGLPGDKIAFKEGVLYRNGKPQEEPYLKFPCDWEMEERLVPEEKIYVVGDNRSMPIEKHKQGLTDISRVIGSPLFY